MRTFKKCSITHTISIVVKTRVPERNDFEQHSPEFQYDNKHFLCIFFIISPESMSF